MNRRLKKILKDRILPMVFIVLTAIVGSVVSTVEQADDMDLETLDSLIPVIVRISIASVFLIKVVKSVKLRNNVRVFIYSALFLALVVWFLSMRILF
ncbi:hypothetical protein HUG15_04270 [Salicibibacter cibarius]|uniref:Uncharacterized protein n=1 Tax=Salicibibacter cibarius TaxID=2743000 RepID=A0A7T7CAH3_9BACI|nr:hypothetical protein [Salicibibacter cibarius]QQK74894.1 hypothetical protein HUG15_04270 [Salicibibacter cibarius]